MPEIKIFVDIKEETKNKVTISPANAEKLGISTGSTVDIINPESGKSTIALAEVSNSALDFAGMISKNIIDVIEFTGIEVIVRPTIAPKSAITSQPSLQQPEQPLSGVAPQLTPVPQPPPSSQLTPTPPPIQPSQPTQLTLLGGIMPVLRNKFTSGAEQDFYELTAKHGLSQKEAQDLFNKLIDEGLLTRDPDGFWRWIK